MSFGGSLQVTSTNRALLRMAVGLAPASLRISVEEFDPIPLANANLDRPESRVRITRHHDRVWAAERSLLVAPE